MTHFPAPCAPKTPLAVCAWLHGNTGVEWTHFSWRKDVSVLEKQGGRRHTQRRLCESQRTQKHTGGSRTATPHLTPATMCSARNLRRRWRAVRGTSGPGQESGCAAFPCCIAWPQVIQRGMSGERAAWWRGCQRRHGGSVRATGEVRKRFWLAAATWRDTPHTCPLREARNNAGDTACRCDCGTMRRPLAAGRPASISSLLPWAARAAGAVFPPRAHSRDALTPRRLPVVQT